MEVRDQIGEVKCDWSPHLSRKRNQIKMRDYMDRWVTPPKPVTSPTWGPPPPCKHALSKQNNNSACMSITIFLYISLLSLHNYQVNWPNFKFTDDGNCKTRNFTISVWTRMRSPPHPLPPPLSLSFSDIRDRATWKNRENV